MNLLKDPFISTTKGKISLKQLLTSEQDYQLQYYFDETQLAMLQLLPSLTTVVLKPNLEDLERYLTHGLSEQEYDQCLIKVDTQWFEGGCFMQSPMPQGVKVADGPITKLVSGIECGSSANALGLFSEVEHVDVVCPDCIHVLNYNLHMNIKGECFGPTGATGIRGGGSISTLVSRPSLKETVFANTIAIDEFIKETHLTEEAEQSFMWQKPPQGEIYYAHTIGLERGLFALAYHINFPIEEKDCVCGVCGAVSDQSVTTFQRVKYTGSYGSTKNGRDGKAGWWLFPYTPISVKEDGVYPICARDQNWQSWQELSSYVVGKEVNKALIEPAYIVRQFRKMIPINRTSLLIGGNIADQGSIVGRVYDLYAMPESLSRDNSKITKVIDAGLEEKEKLSLALNKIFGIGYDKNFVSGIKEQAIQSFICNAQQIIQQILQDVDRKEAKLLRADAILRLTQVSHRIFSDVQRKYQYDLPLFRALVKGESQLNRSSSFKEG
ncbi:putative CRISPR-associated protein [Vibrio halioticoli NBRC 102217]|uniref:Putative CRISPR-associated protein n=1 Tax=Vibrio halioticoli NBRC 102217 TaxID=1219072 RepID=V5FE94_9VIBR|nr:type I-E CRISPR-associated protein Cse1/CasA [Vibrio halioticoli]GAD89978.1 putative CRISPR-associated protein [Vibrio halioticoli NBRC 102217]